MDNGQNKDFLLLSVYEPNLQCPSHPHSFVNQDSGEIHELFTSQNCTFPLIISSIVGGGSLFLGLPGSIHLFVPMHPSELILYEPHRIVCSAWFVCPSVCAPRSHQTRTVAIQFHQLWLHVHISYKYYLMASIGWQHCSLIGLACTSVVCCLHPTATSSWHRISTHSEGRRSRWSIIDFKRYAVHSKITLLKFQVPPMANHSLLLFAMPEEIKLNS